MPHLITTADDFGLSPAVNEAVERAAREGILTSASLMVGAPHAADAVRRAKALGGKLKVGLHLVVIEGPAVLPPARIPDLVDEGGHFPGDQLKLGLRYAVSPGVRRQLAEEIDAQFAAFRATGLALDHANAHKHMHLHPVVGGMMIRIGKEYGLRALRVPAELPGLGAHFGDRALFWWTRLLRWQARRAGLVSNDGLSGLAQTGHMTPAIVQALVDALRPGVTEMYFHPATHTDDALRRTMPDYEHAGELRALLETQLPAGVTLTAYSEVCGLTRDQV
jgi:hopanoid biosynthesis associated protein HpnK